MADRDKLEQIRKEQAELPTQMTTVLVNGGANAHDDLADALDVMTAAFRRTADLYAEAKLKGAQSAYVVPLRNAATEVAKVAEQLRKSPAPAPAPAPVADVPRQHADTSHERLDDLVNSAVAEGRGMLKIEQKVADEASPAFAETADTLAFLSGAVDTLPGLADALVPSGVRDQTDAIRGIADTSGITEEQRAKLDTLTDHSIPAREPMLSDVLAERITDWSNDVTNADGYRLPGTPTGAPLLGQPGDASGGYRPDYIPPGGRVYTYGDLMAAVPAASLPAHVSHSQMETIGDCPAKYRISRIDNAPQVPQWALVGGGAFHKAVEAIELTLINAAAAGRPLKLDGYNCELGWKEHFEQECARVEQSSPVPRSMWRASDRGRRNETWWQEEGPKMLRRYLDARNDEQTISLDGAQPGHGTPAIEHEITVQVGTPYGPVPFTAVLDRVTFRPADGAIVVRDYKTGARMPEDAAQLAEQAWALYLSGVIGNTPTVVGTFFNAGKGVWTDDVDLFADYPYEWFVYRVTSAHAQKLALTQGPTPARPSSFCGGCPVRYACPIKGAKA